MNSGCGAATAPPTRLLTGEWEYKLAQMEHGKLSRESFMADIAAMTRSIVSKAKGYDRDSVPGDYAVKLLATGKTDLLDKFVSMRTRRAFKAHLAWDQAAGKVNFEFAPSKFPPKPAAARTGTVKTPFGKTVAAKSATAAAAKKVAVKKVAAKSDKPKVARKTSAGAGLKPSDALAAVIGVEPVARTQVIKKLWDYIKEQGLQDAGNKRAINADAKLLPVFGKPQVTMFELAGIVGKHLS